MNEMLANLKDHPVLDVPYIRSFFSNLSPIEINLAAALKGLRTRPPGEPFTYCELGCGQGMSTNMFAACFPGSRFYGIDLNAAHIASARQLAEAGKLSNVTFINDVFDAVIEEPLPRFDYIVCHGVYSWVSAEIRDDIRKFVARHLKNDGLFYVGYNALPGWSPLLPLRALIQHLSADHPGDSCEKISTSLKRLKELQKLNAPYFKNVPEAAALVGSMFDESPNYLAHEYLNESWQPQYFEEVTAEMTAIGLSYCGSTDPASEKRHQVARKALGGILDIPQDPIVAEGLSSLVLCEKFRHDVFCRDRHRAEPVDPAILKPWIFGGSPAKRAGPVKVPAKDAETMRLIQPLIRDGGRSVAGILAHPAMAGVSIADAESSLRHLLAAEVIHPFAAKAIAAPCDARDDFIINSAFNRALLHETVLEGKALHLASCITGNGVKIPNFMGVIVLGVDAVGMKDSVEWIWKFYEKAGKSLGQNGRPVTGVDHLRECMARKFTDFSAEWLPLLWRLGIVGPRV